MRDAAPMVDHDERDATMAAAIENFKSGEFGKIRTTAILVMCGLNAKEIEEILAPLASAAFENYKSFGRAPVK